MIVRADKQIIYELFEAAVEAAAMTHQAVELLDGKAVRTLIGEKAVGMSGTFAGNLQRKLVKEMQRAELQSAADWIRSLVLPQYPGAVVSIKRGRIVQVYLDGLPKEVT